MGYGWTNSAQQSHHTGFRKKYPIASNKTARGPRRKPPRRSGDYNPLKHEQTDKKGQPIGQPFLTGCRLSEILVKTLFDTSSLTSTLTQVVQFSFTNSTTTFDRNAVNYRRVSLKTRSTPSPLEILRTVNAECRPRLRIAITTPSNACRRFWNLQQPILSLPRYHPDGRKVRPASSALVQVA